MMCMKEWHKMMEMGFKEDLALWFIRSLEMALPPCNHCSSLFCTHIGNSIYLRYQGYVIFSNFQYNTCLYCWAVLNENGM